MFEKAARMKLRFDFRGSVSVEDLWDMPVRDLDGIFKVLNVKSKTQQEESLLDTRNREDVIVALKIDIVKHIVKVKLQERDEYKESTERRARKGKLMAILEEKQDAALHEFSPEQLQKLIKELG